MEEDEDLSEAEVAVVDPVVAVVVTEVVVAAMEVEVVSNDDTETLLSRNRTVAVNKF